MIVIGASVIVAHTKGTYLLEVSTMIVYRAGDEEPMRPAGYYHRERRGGFHP